MLSTKCYWGENVKDDIMDRTCSTHGINDEAYKTLNLKGIDDSQWCTRVEAGSISPP
jgi:hypothetical protein